MVTTRSQDKGVEQVSNDLRATREWLHSKMTDKDRLRLQKHAEYLKEHPEHSARLTQIRQRLEKLAKSLGIPQSEWKYLK